MLAGAFSVVSAPELHVLTLIIAGKHQHFWK